MSRLTVLLRLVTLSKDFFFYFGLALIRGQSDQDIIILLRTVDFLIKVTLSRDTAIFFRLGRALCPRGLPWTNGWQLNLTLSSIAVVLPLVTLCRYLLFFSGRALNRGQGDQDILIMSRIAAVQIKVTLSRPTAIFFRLGCDLCPRGLPWATGWQINITLSRTAVVLLLITLSR